MRSIARLRQMAGGVLIATALVAPWFWAVASELGARWVTGALLLATVLAAPSWLARWERKTFVPTLPIAAGLLLILGWGSSWQARQTIDPFTGYRYERAPMWPGWPGSQDGAASLAAMPLLSALLGAMLVTADLARDRGWRRGLVRALVANGAALAFLGLLQRWTQANDIYWGETRHLDYFFATFRNVTHAGIWLNLLLPFALIETEQPVSASGKSFNLWSMARPSFALILGAGVLTAGSKLALPVALVELTLLGLLLRREIAQRLARLRVRAWLGGGFLLLVFAALAIGAADLAISGERWHQFFSDSQGVTWAHRCLVDRVVLEALPQAGLWGLGPATFPTLFPGLASAAGLDLPGFWPAAHNDYLQTVLEWGVGGTLLWSAIFFGGLFRCWRRTRRDSFTQAALASGLVGLALAMAVDFPLQTPAIQLLAALLLGLAWRRESHRRAGDFPESHVNFFLPARPVGSGPPLRSHASASSPHRLARVAPAAAARAAGRVHEPAVSPDHP